MLQLFTSSQQYCSQRYIFKIVQTFLLLLISLWHYADGAATSHLQWYVQAVLEQLMPFWPVQWHNVRDTLSEGSWNLSGLILSNKHHLLIAAAQSWFAGSKYHIADIPLIRLSLPYYILFSLVAVDRKQSKNLMTSRWTESCSHLRLGTMKILEWFDWNKFFFLIIKLNIESFLIHDSFTVTKKNTI